MFPKRTLPSVSPAASWNNMEERRTSRTWHNSTTETIHHLGSKGHTAGLCFMVMLPDVTPYPPPRPHLSRTFWKCHSEFGDLTAVFKALGSRSYRSSVLLRRLKLMRSRSQFDCFDAVVGRLINTEDRMDCYDIFKLYFKDMRTYSPDSCKPETLCIFFCHIIHCQYLCWRIISCVGEKGCRPRFTGAKFILSKEQWALGENCCSSGFYTDVKPHVVTTVSLYGFRAKTAK